jgi:poly(3-hydroxybutyrate) depolymerase
MLDALTVPAAVAAPASAATLTVIDTSDTSADLAWTAQAETTAYRISRAAADGPFSAVADVAGPSFADSGLTPASAYRWRVSPLVNGVEGPASEATATTRAAPAPCDNPGTCPVVK